MNYSRAQKILFLFSFLLCIGIVWYKDAHPVMLAAASTLPIAGQTYNIAGSGVSSSATSITLTSLTIKQTGQPIQDADLGDTFYLTLEPGSNSKQEIIGCTTVGTNNGGAVTISGCTRGLAPISPYTASTTLQFTHAGGSQVIFSNPPQFYNQFHILANAATSSAILVFSSTSPPRLDYTSTQRTGTYIATTSEFVTWDGLNAVVIAGAANATAAVKGILQLATGAQAGSSTILGSTGASLALTSAIASSSPFTTPTQSGSVIPVTGSQSGKLSQLFLNLTEAFTWTGMHIFNATTSIAASGVFSAPLKLNTLSYAFPNARAASSTTLSEDGNGNLTWEAYNTARFLGATTTSSIISSTVDSTSLGTIAAGLMKGNGVLRVDVLFTARATSGAAGPTIGLKFGAATVCSISLPGVFNTSDSTAMLEFLISNNNSPTAQVGFVTTTFGQGASSPTNAAWAIGNCSASVDTTSSQVVKINIAPGANDIVTTTGIYANFLGSN